MALYTLHPASKTTWDVTTGRVKVGFVRKLDDGSFRCVINDGYKMAATAASPGDAFRAALAPTKAAARAENDVMRAEMASLLRPILS